MEVVVSPADGTVLMYGQGLGPLNGVSPLTLGGETEAALLAALSAPNGGVTLTGITTDSSGVSSGAVTALPYVAPAPPPPTQVAAGSGVPGATVALHQPDPNMSTDIRGIVDVTVAEAPTADANGHYPLAAITFGTPWPAAPLGAMIDRVGANAVALGLVFSDALAATGFQIVAEKAPMTGQTYRLSYALG